MAESTVDLEFTIHELLEDVRSVSEFMARLVDAHAEKYPDGDWSCFKSIDYEREIHRLRYVWLPRTFYGQPPAKVSVAGLWFGTFQARRSDTTGKEEAVAEFYVSGTDQFQIDGNANWASTPVYVPEGDCAGSNVLASISRLADAEANRLKPGAEQYLCVGYVASTVAELLKDFDCSLIVGGNTPVGVAVGWNAGDPLYIGHVTRLGFKLRPPKEAIAGIMKRREEFKRRFEAKYGSRLPIQSTKRESLH